MHGCKCTRLHAYIHGHRCSLHTQKLKKKMDTHHHTVRRHAHTNACMYTCMYKCVYIYTSLSINIYTDIYTYICIHIYIYTSIYNTRV